jgi:hypothetical protein
MNNDNIDLKTSHSRNQVVQILREQLDAYPTFLESFLTLNARYWKGSAPVCGTVETNEFEMRNRQGPGFSLIANGKLADVKNGTQIQLTFSKPNLLMRVQSLLVNRYDNDRKIIIDFLAQWLQAEKV